MIERGNVKIRTNNCFIEIISSALYVPELTINILSVGQVQENGYTITIEKGIYQIYNPIRGAIAIVEMPSHRMFPLEIVSIHTFFN